ncbi:MAG: flagellar biosynthesis protein [Rubrivivax sp.]|nr:flagellar biosynthesis protein [Rubrivivax sp.]
MQDIHLSAPADQAHGLRRLFAGTQVQHIALVANPHVAFTGVVLERLTTVLGTLGLHTLVVDAADTSPAPQELAALDLRAGIETLSPRVSYLAARGLPLGHVDTRGSSAHFLDRLQAAAPQCGVLLVHAGAGDLARLYAQRALRPLLLASEQPEAVTHAYAAMKLLVMRRQLMSYDLLLAAPPALPRTRAVAQRLASCAENFLGASLHDWVAVDPACDVREEPGDALTGLVAAQLRGTPEGVEAPTATAHAWRATAPRHAAMNPN